MLCDKILIDGIDKITGEEKFVRVKYQIENKNNKCKYFKKRLFAKKSDIKYCCNCKYQQRDSSGYPI